MKSRATSCRARSKSKRTKESREQVLAKILALIKRNPGIRPSEINRRLNVQQTDALRDALVRRGLVRKVKDGRAIHLYVK